VSANVLDGPATEPTLAFLDSLLWERADKTLADFDEAKRPKSQRQASAWIDELRARPALPVTDEQKDQIVALAAQMGETYEMPSTRDAANRIVFSLRKRLNSRLYHAEKAAAKDTLESLIGPVSEDAVPF